MFKNAILSFLKSARKTLVFLAVVASLAVSVLAWIYVDPTGEIQVTVEDRMADIVVSGKNVGVPPKYIGFDERLFQKACIEKADQKSDVVALGSGRIKYIRDTMFPGKKFHNSSVNAAAFEDIVILYHLYKKHGLLPGKIIVSLDHYMIESQPSYLGWRVLSEDYNDAIAQMGLVLRGPQDAATPPFWKNKRAARTLEVLEPENMLKSISRLLVGRSAMPRMVFPTIESKTRSGLYVWLSDGSMGSEAVPWTEEEVRKIIATIDDGAPALKKVDESRVNDIRKFIALAEKDGVKVQLLLVPVHPHTYAKWAKDDSKGVIEAESVYRRLASETNTPICGSFDPAKTPAEDGYFQNWINPHDVLLGKIIEQCDIN